MRVIDFGLVRNVDVHTSRVSRFGSDHHAVVFDCLHGRKRLRVGLWNIERDRRPGVAVAELFDLIALSRLDVVLLCEANDYMHQLAHLPGWTLTTGRGQAGDRETAILTRYDVKVSSTWVAQLTRAGWFTVRGGRTSPKYLPTALLNGWLRVAVVHTPPSCRFKGGKHGPVGPVRRVAAFVALMRRVRLFARRRPAGQSVLIAGDWNATPTSRGVYSPRWLARAGRLRFAAPKEGTHA